MCGIAGVIGLAGQRVCPDTLATLSGQLYHRGPDDHGFMGWSPNVDAAVSHDSGVVANRTIGFASRRLAIIDLSDAGAQPMGTADRRYWIVYNGEVYNYVELRRELEERGCQFRSASDTEVVLHALAQWGRAALSRFVGMFSLAILDTHEQTLLLARDQFGIKPLFVLSSESNFLFASEITPLFKFVAPHPKLNPVRAYQYLRFGRSDESAETMVDGIQSLKPGHTLEISLKGGEVGPQLPYWSLQVGERADVSFPEAVAVTREMFLRNIELHLRSDVPIGACLSGGIDSSACVAAMRHVKGAALDLQTFTYSAGAGHLDETRWANVVSTAVNACAHVVTASARELVQDVDSLIRIQGEPFATTSIYAQHLVFRLIKSTGVKVVLDGQGADEMLGGYALFYAARIASAIRKGHASEAWTLSRAALTRDGFGRAPLVATQFLLPRVLQAPLRRLVGREVAPRWVDQAWFASWHDRSGETDRRSPDLFRQELVSSLTGSLRALLRYEDRNSMAASVESRLPFLTPDLVQFLLTLPEEYLISSGGNTKAVFREAMRGIVPNQILDRRDKISFQTPESNWMPELATWADPILSSDFARACPIVNHEQAMQAWQHALREPEGYQSWLWRWLNLVRWGQIHSIAWQT